MFGFKKKVKEENRFHVEKLLVKKEDLSKLLGLNNGEVISLRRSRDTDELIVYINDPSLPKNCRYITDKAIPEKRIVLLNRDGDYVARVH